ncbi:D-serine dehydratase, partial [Pseudomonas aeruginosa]|nr:D-serine dehydratase [Pseudomonas aeruginosa]
MILGTPKADWLAEFPRLADLIALRPSEWFNPAIAPSAEALALSLIHISEPTRRS